MTGFPQLHHQAVRRLVHVCSLWWAWRYECQMTPPFKYALPLFNPLSTRPHQNVVWYNNSWLGFLKILNLYRKKEKNKLQKISPHLSQLDVVMAHRNYLGAIICESSNWQHIQRLKITILGANWQVFRLERIAKCSYFILSTQNIKLLICNEYIKEIYVANLMIQ